MSKKPQTVIASGVLIAGKYQLIRQIGEGAMGVVWAAVNVATAREVALKLITRPEEEFRLRLQREARNCGALKHKHVVDVYDINETEAGEPFLVMQLLSGETVAELLVRKRRLLPDVAAGIGRDVAKGLAAAHAMHIIHRDLKPANVFLHREAGEEAPVVKVLDFGVAKNLAVNDGLHTMTGGAVGSPLYMSPEQVRADGKVDHRADIWALGVLLFEMLTGERPFKGDAREVFTGILSGDIPTVSRRQRRIDPRLDELVARCMRRARDERFGSAAEVAALLDTYAAAEAGSAATSPFSQSGVGLYEAGNEGEVRAPPPSRASAPSYVGVASAITAFAPAPPSSRDSAPVSFGAPPPASAAALETVPAVTGGSGPYAAVTASQIERVDDNSSTLPMNAAAAVAVAQQLARRQAASLPQAAPPVAPPPGAPPLSRPFEVRPPVAPVPAAMPPASGPQDVPSSVQAMPPDAPWPQSDVAGRGTVRMPSAPWTPGMPQPSGVGPAEAAPAAPPWMPPSTVKLGPEFVGNIADWKRNWRGSTQEPGASTTTPLVTRSSESSQPGGLAPPVAPVREAQGGSGPQRTTAVVVAVAAAVVSLVGVVLFLWHSASPRSGPAERPESPPDATASAERTAPSESAVAPPAARPDTSAAVAEPVVREAGVTPPAGSARIDVANPGPSAVRLPPAAGTPKPTATLRTQSRSSQTDQCAGKKNWLPKCAKANDPYAK